MDGISSIWVFFTYLANYTELGKILPVSPFQRAMADSDFSSLISSIQGFMGYVNWFVPVGIILKILTFWGIAIGVFYGVMAILRWVRIVGD